MGTAVSCDRLWCAKSSNPGLQEGEDDGRGVTVCQSDGVVMGVLGASSGVLVICTYEVNGRENLHPVKTWDTPIRDGFRIQDAVVTTRTPVAGF